MFQWRAYTVPSGTAGGQRPPLQRCQAVVVRRGRCPHRPAGGHIGPPLRILTDGADGRERLIRHGLRPCHLPLKGKALWAHAVRPYMAARDRAATWGHPYENFGPLLPVGADLRVRPSVLGAHIGAPLHGGGGKSPPYMVRTIRRGRCPHRPGPVRTPAPTVRSGTPALRRYSPSTANSYFLTPNSSFPPHIPPAPRIE